VAAWRTLFCTSLILLLLAPASVDAASSLDITIPTSYHINAARAYDVSNNAVNIGGDIEFFHYGNGVYVAITTDAPAGDKLAFFQDAVTQALFRNNTLFIPVDDAGDQTAGLVLSTGDLICDNGAFYGPVTGIELDTKALAYGDAVAGAVLYMGKWPDWPSYHLSISNDETIKKALMDEAAKDGTAGGVKLMLNVSGDSIGYVVVHMEAPEASSNVSAYLYRDGVVTRLACRAIHSNGSVVYETMYSGGGTFAFVGPFPETPPAPASFGDVLAFSVYLGSGLLLLFVGLAVTAFKKRSNKY